MSSSSSSLINVITYYQRSIEKNGHDEKRLLHCIEKLYKLPVKLEHLQTTGVGKTVNSLRKYDKEVGVAAKALVAKWKAMVAAEAQVAVGEHDEDEDIQSEPDNDDHNDDNTHTDSQNNRLYDHRNGNSHHSKHNERSSSSNNKERNHNVHESGSKHKSHEHRSHSSHSSSKRKHEEHRREKHFSSYSKKDDSRNRHRHEEHSRTKVSDSDSQEDEKNVSSLSIVEAIAQDFEIIDDDDEEKLIIDVSKEKTEEMEKNSKTESQSYSKNRHHSSKDYSKKESSHSKESLRREHRRSKERSPKESSRDKESTKKESSRNSKENSDKHSNSSKERSRKESNDSKDSSRNESSDSKETSRKESSHSKGSSRKENNHSKDSSHSSSSHSKETSRKESSHSRDKDKISEKKERKEDRHKSEESHKSKHNEFSDKESKKKDEEKQSSSSHKSNGEHHKSKYKDKERHKDNEKDSRHKDNDRKRKNSESDSKSSESSPTKAKVPKILVDGIDSSMGTSFEEALGMISASSSSKSSKVTKTSPRTNPSSSSSGSGNFVKPSSRSSPTRSKTPPLLSSKAKLEPLDPSIVLELPTISPNYKPLPLNPTVMECVFAAPNKQQTPRRQISDEEAMSAGISSKTIRTKVYSGVKTGALLQVPTLFDLCIRILQKNIDALEYTGGVPFEVLKPVLERATPQQLLTFEEFNPYLMEDSDILWQQHCGRLCRGQKRLELETWREMFLRCKEEQERKLNMLAENIKQSQKHIQTPIRKTQLAYVDTMVKPPRNVQRKQEQYGTKSSVVATPAARVAALSNITPNASKAGDFRVKAAASAPDTVQIATAAAAAANNGRPKKAPLMQKTIKFMKGRFRR